MLLVTRRASHIHIHIKWQVLQHLLLFVSCCMSVNDVCMSAAKLRDEFTIFVQGAFSMLPYEFPGSRFKRAKEAQRHINGVVSGERPLPAHFIPLASPRCSFIQSDILFVGSSTSVHAQTSHLVDAHQWQGVRSTMRAAAFHIEANH